VYGLIVAAILASPFHEPTALHDGQQQVASDRSSSARSSSALSSENKTAQPAVSFRAAAAALNDTDTTKRRTALVAIREYEHLVITQKNAIFALEAATKQFPHAKNETSKIADPAAALVDAAAARCDLELIPYVKKYFPEYGPSARYAALSLLLKTDSREGADLFMNLVRKYGARSFKSLPFHILENNTKFADIVFPQILEFAVTKDHAFGIWHLCWEYCEAGVFKRMKLGEAPTKGLITETRSWIARAKRFQKSSGGDWIWTDDYQDMRSELTLRLDLLGYFPKAGAVPVLKEAINLRDNKQKLYAAISLLEHGENPSSETLKILGADPETRQALFQQLGDHKREDLFPKEFYTQKALAESDMINWLTYPTELGKPPDDLELMKILTVRKSAGDGSEDEDVASDALGSDVSDTLEAHDSLQEYYIYRFREKHSHEGRWMACIAGPYPKAAAAPDVEGGDYTFSQFDLWESKTPEEHLLAIDADAEIVKP